MDLVDALLISFNLYLIERDREEGSSLENISLNKEKEKFRRKVKRFKECEEEL